jgi:hypothetical protein
VERGVDIKLLREDGYKKTTYMGIGYRKKGKDKKKDVNKDVDITIKTRTHRKQR